MRFLRCTFVLALLCAASARPCGAELKVERVLWGVDGKLREERFNLITYELFNNSDQHWEGDLLLQPTLGLTNVDVLQVQPGVFIEPYGRRQVQFVVFVPTANNFELKWGRRAEQRFLPDDEPQVAKDDAVIQLVDFDSAALKTANVATFDESIFPTSVAGFDGVHAILLDHVPRWDQLRMRTLKDWVYRGGTLHLFLESGDRYPEFPAALAELNEPSDELRFGSGRVVRHPVGLAQAEKAYIAQHVAPPERADGQQPEVSYLQWFLPSKVLTTLREMTQPEHQWWLIYTMAVVYLAAIFPGCYFVAKKRGDFRLTYLSLLAVVALFGMGFRSVGARGYGEETVINSAAIARPVSDGRVEVTQWSNFFVTGGGQFRVLHKAEGLVYGTGQAMEGVRGFAQNRPLGALAVDIPSFSGRSIVHAGVVKTAVPRLNLETFVADGATPAHIKLTWVAPDGRPEGNIKTACAVYGNELYSLERSPDGYVGGSHHPLSSALSENNWAMYQDPWERANKRNPDALFEVLRQMLMAYDMGLKNQDQLTQSSLPPGQMRVYLFADMPPEFEAAVSVSAAQRGRVLYVIDVPVPNGLGNEVEVKEKE